MTSQRSRQPGSQRSSKIAVSLPAEQVRALKGAVRAGRAPSVSAYVSEALAQRLRDEEFATMLAEWRAEVGPPTEEETGWAERALGLR